MLNLTETQILLSPNTKVTQNKKYWLALGLVLFIVLIVFIISTCFVSSPAKSKANNEANLFHFKQTSTLFNKPIKSLSWKTFSLNDEGLYVLKINSKTTIPLAELVRDFHIYISTNSLNEENYEASEKIFIPSSGETLIELSPLKLLSEEGVSLAFKSHALIYLTSPENSSIPEIEIYKIGPSSPIMADSTHTNNFKES